MARLSLLAAAAAAAAVALIICCFTAQEAVAQANNNINANVNDINVAAHAGDQRTGTVSGGSAGGNGEEAADATPCVEAPCLQAWEREPFTVSLVDDGDGGATAAAGARGVGNGGPIRLELRSTHM